MSIATLIRRMAELGCPPEAIALAVEEIEALQMAASNEPRLVADRERAARRRERLGLNDRQWRSLRLQVFKRDDFTCQYCDASKVPLSCDHIVPLIQGGSNEMDNLTTACIPCNSAKGGRTPEEWQA